MLLVRGAAVGQRVVYVRYGRRNEVNDWDVEVVRSADLAAGRVEGLRALLLRAFGGDFGEDDWGHALGGWHVVVTGETGETGRAGSPVGHAALVERALEVGERWFRAGYVEAVATEPALQGRGIGSAAMGAIGQLLRDGFDLGALSTGRPGFYERLGWVRWQGPTFVRRGADLVRTADEDDGIMVLRYGPTAVLDRRLPIACESRPGDDW
jgi:aminoglycoside 2'-N-acetyltransferase I